MVNFIFGLYRIFLSPALHLIIGAPFGCRHKQSCSAFYQDMVKQKGWILGSVQGFKRVLTCHPYSTDHTARFLCYKK